MHSNEVGLAQIRKWESIEYSGNHPTAADESEIMGKLMPMLISKTKKTVVIKIPNHFQNRKHWKSPRTADVAVATTHR